LQKSKKHNNMKKIFSYLFAGLLVISAASCKKLDLAPLDYFGSGNFWKNKSQVDGAMIGLHSQLRDYQFTFYTMGEMRGGDLMTGTGATGTSSLNSQSIITQDLRESSPGISNWGGLYNPIFQVNNFISQVEKATYLTDQDKSYYLGQAYGLRAFYYFNLYRTFGRVPLAKEPKVLTNTPTSADQAYLPRAATEKETLDFIKSDIDNSVKNFNGDYTSKGNKSQWSLGATNMLKSEVYLWTAKVRTDGQAPQNTAADLTVARTALEDLISHYTLQSNFGDVFKYKNKGNSEIIFALRYAVGEASNNFSQFVYQASDPMASFVNSSGGSLVPNRYQSDVSKTGDPMNLLGSGIIRYEYQYALYQQFDTALDSRAKSTFFDIYKPPIADNKFVLLSKFLGTIDNGSRIFADDIPVYRLAEAYLLLAEIKNKQGEDPSAEINLIRARAYGSNPYPVYVNGSFEENELAIFEERQKEFVGEGKRWYDLRRMQDANGDPLAFKTDVPLVGVLSKDNAYKLLWPIDRSTLTSDETLVNDQNPGYPGT
jgi:hypothetical protein